MNQFFHGLHIRVKVIEILRTFLAYIDQACVLQNLQMVRYCRAGQIRFLCDLANAHPTTVIHLHHFYEKMLTVFIPYGRQDLLTFLNFVSHCPCFLIYIH